MAALGWQPDVQVLPDPTRLSLLAVAQPGPARPPSRSELRLYDALPRRRSSRVPYVDQPISPEVVVTLEDAAVAEGANLQVLTTDEAAEMSRLIRAADAMQRSNPDVRREVAAWTARPAGAVDGLPDEALGPLPADQASVVRDFGLDRPLANRRRAKFEPGADACRCAHRRRRSGSLGTSRRGARASLARGDRGRACGAVTGHPAARASEHAVADPTAAGRPARHARCTEPRSPRWLAANRPSPRRRQHEHPTDPAPPRGRRPHFLPAH